MVSTVSALQKSVDMHQTRMNIRFLIGQAVLGGTLANLMKKTVFRKCYDCFSLRVLTKNR